MSARADIHTRRSSSWFVRFPSVGHAQAVITACATMPLTVGAVYATVSAQFAPESVMRAANTPTGTEPPARGALEQLHKAQEFQVSCCVFVHAWGIVNRCTQAHVDARVAQVAMDVFYADLAATPTTVVAAPAVNAAPVVDPDGTHCTLCDKRFPDAAALQKHCKVSQSHRALLAQSKARK